jgi:hypothetical protein
MQKTLTLVDSTGERTKACLTAKTSPKAFVELQSDFYNSGVIECDRIYEGFQELHQRLDAKVLKLLCMGYRYDVRPSGMALSMGHGTLAYKVHLGKPATEKVGIFDETEDENSIVTYEEQNIYYRKWFDSLKKL